MPPLLYQPFFAHPDHHLYAMAPPTYHPECEYLHALTPSQAGADMQPPAVTITLRSTRPITNLSRNIILRPDEPVNVGRSSRSEAKNLSATANNALFDCPVISRRHAELELKVNKWTEERHQVYIKDTGSMHGTSVNGQKLQPSKPFQLQVGDTIRLGESVNRADSKYFVDQFSCFLTNTTEDNYDGVTLTLAGISTATKKNTAQVKSSIGISVPSASESDFDDDDDVSDGGADLRPSSVHTTPDQTNDKTGAQTSAKMGSSVSNVIMLEDDEDDEPVPLSGRRALAQTIVIPDTYADDGHMVADSLAPARDPIVSGFCMQFDGAQDSSSEIKGIGAAIAANADEESDHEHDDSEHSWSDQEHISDEEQDSDEHSDSHEDFDRQSFLSEEFNMADEVAVEDDEDEEGPEVMSSKRRFSNELGTLGDEPKHDMPDAAHETFPARPHYDPVRGFQVPAQNVDKAPAYRSYDPYLMPPLPRLFADFGHSNKWDVGPGPVVDDFNLHNFGFVSHSASLLDNMNDDTHSGKSGFNNFAPFNYAYAPPTATASRDFFGVETNPNVPSNSPVSAFPKSGPEATVLLNMKKRKAPDISTADEPTTTSQTPAVNDEIVREATTSLVPICAEPEQKKRKIKQPHAHKSLLRTAVIEAGKYTAGAIIGGIGLVTILASPIGEALASC
jgi:pSer/pThr/pTyr-binding forkhead associated (FHA) protein